MHRLVVFRTDLLVYEDCRFHHERKDMQLEKIPKWKMEDQDKCKPYVYSRTLNQWRFKDTVTGGGGAKVAGGV